MNLARSNPAQLALGAVIVLGAVYLFGRGTIRGAVGAVKNVNQGTPYEGFGPIGTLGNVANRVLFGIPQAIGEKIGGGLADLRDWLGRSSELRKGYTSAASSSPTPPEAKARINVGVG